ncbi:MAG: hypothetical protein V8R01_05085 [Bacilli bacterium]
MAQENPNNTKETGVTVEENKEAVVKVVETWDEYLAVGEDLMKIPGESPYDDLAKRAELWSTYYTSNLEYSKKKLLEVVTYKLSLNVWETFVRKHCLVVVCIV